MAHVEKEIEVDKPVDQVYSQWTQFEQFPKFMENVEEVRQLDDKHLEWKAKVAGTERSWKAEIVEQKPNRVIAWRAVRRPRGAWKTTLSASRSSSSISRHRPASGPARSVRARSSRTRQRSVSLRERSPSGGRSFRAEAALLLNLHSLSCSVAAAWL